MARTGGFVPRTPLRGTSAVAVRGFVYGYDYGYGYGYGSARELLACLRLGRTCGDQRGDARGGGHAIATRRAADRFPGMAGAAPRLRL